MEMLTRIRLRLLETAVFGSITAIAGFVVGLVCGCALEVSHNEKTTTTTPRRATPVRYTNYYNRTPQYTKKEESDES